MKKLFNIIALMLLCQLTAFAQGDMTKYTLTVEPSPKGTYTEFWWKRPGVDSYANNRTSTELKIEVAAGQQVDLCIKRYSYASYKPVYLMSDGARLPIIEQTSFEATSGAVVAGFIMPDHDATITIMLEYDPILPPNPNKEDWNEQTGSIVVNDFVPGQLQYTIRDAISQNSQNADYTKVNSITVSGKMATDDWDMLYHNYFTNLSFFDISRTSGLETLEYRYSNRNNETLTTLLLPATIKTIRRGFNLLKALRSLTCYATTPPTLTDDALKDLSPEVYVPAESLTLYLEAEGWKDMTLLPITENVSSMKVNLPAGTNTASYKDMYLELVNTQTGQTQRYVITSQQSYTFNNLIHNTHYNIYIRNVQGQVLGLIAGIDMVDRDVEATFTDLKTLYDISLKLLTPAGKDVTSQATITWTDEQGNYLQKGSTLKGQIEGTKVGYTIKLPEAIGTLYQQPSDTTVTVGKQSTVSCRLSPLPKEVLTGTVTAESTGRPIRGANITMTQLLNGLYPETLTATTDNEGRWQLNVSQAPSELTVAATGYVSQTQALDIIVNSKSINSQLRDITGTTVNLDLYYRPAVPAGEELVSADFYDGFTDIGYTIYDETHQQEVTGFSVQWPLIVLPEKLPTGTQLRITANSLNQKFMPVSGNCTVDSLNTARLTLPITQMGSVVASFDETENLSVTGMLYRTDGQFVARGKYEKGVNDIKPTLTFNDVADGQYILITMGESRFFNAFATLGALLESGLQSKVDYVGDMLDVVSGRIDSVKIGRVPTFDESILYYTGEGTRFSVNKTQVTVGNYVTLRAQVDFKAGVADGISNVQLLFDLPEGCKMVDNSMMVGSSLANYQEEGNRVSVGLDDISQTVRFCIVPTLSGNCEPTATIAFTQNGNTIVQPIGTASFETKALTLNIPEKTALKIVPVTGMGMPRSKVQIYDDGVLIGQTEVQANGFWSARCPLNKPYNLSTHAINAIITTPDGIQMATETKTLNVNQSSLSPVVTMSFFNHYNNGDVVVKWDFRTGKCDKSNYGWPMDIKSLPFTFRVDFMDGDVAVNDTLAFGNVELTVFLDDGTQLQMPATFNKRMNAWVVQYDITTTSLPVNVDVTYSTLTEPKLDREMMTNMMNEIETAMEERRQEAIEIYRKLDINAESEHKDAFSELDELLSNEQLDDAEWERVDSLLDVISGGEFILVSDQFSLDKLDFSEVDSLLNIKDSDIQTQKRITELLNRMGGDQPKSIDEYDIVAELLQQNFNEEATALSESLQQSHDELLTMLAMVYCADTTALEKPETISFNKVNGNNQKNISISILDNIDIDQLMAEGYQYCPMTDGTLLLFRYDETGMSCIDVKNKKCYSTTITETDSTASGRKRIMTLFLTKAMNKFLQRYINWECIAYLGQLVRDWFKTNKNVKDAQDGGFYEYFSAFGSNTIASLNDSRAVFKCIYEHAMKVFHSDMDAIFAKTDKDVAKYADNAKVKEEECYKKQTAANSNIEKNRAMQKRWQSKRSQLVDIINSTDPNNKIILNDLNSELKQVEKNIDGYHKAILSDQKILKNAEKDIKWFQDIQNASKQLVNNLPNTKTAMLENVYKTFPKTLNEFIAGSKMITKTTGEIAKWVGTPLSCILQIGTMYFTIQDNVLDIMRWDDFYRFILAKYPCKEDPIEWQHIRDDYNHDFRIHVLLDLGHCLCDVGGFICDLTSAPGVTPQWYGSLACDITSGLMSMYHPNASAGAMDKLRDRLNALKCKKKDKDKNNSSKKFNNVIPVRDPSGFVYEAVESNRLEGVKTTCFYKEMKEDMYGDLYENVVVWDAEEYAQENPLFTDAEGKYAWDVPTGLWQVKFEKEGYETAYSEWLPVPPPQLEVNVGMTQLRQPAVSRVKACTDGIDITFDKYMDPQTLTTGNIFVTHNGQTVPGTITLLNAESAPGGSAAGAYASQLRFNANFSANDKIQLTIRHTVESYAGLQMEQDYTQQFDIEQRITAIVADSIINLSEGSERTITVSILPAEAAKGKTLTATALTDDVVAVTPNGDGTFALTALSLGQSAVRFCLTDDADITATTLVTVRDAAMMYVYAPQSSRMSGTEVYRGAEIRLTCATAGATILYTLDGSCPCDAQNAAVLTYTAPITATGTELTIRAMAVANGMAESDVAEFRYKVVDNPVAIEAPTASGGSAAGAPVSYYRLDGRRTTKLQKGLNIVRQADGTVRKQIKR